MFTLHKLQASQSSPASCSNEDTRAANEQIGNVTALSVRIDDRIGGILAHLPSSLNYSDSTMPSAGPVLI